MDNDSKLALLMSAIDRECTVDMVIDWLASEGYPDDILDSLTAWDRSPIVTTVQLQRWKEAVAADKHWVATVRGC